jgi:hypothetical protein
MKQKEEKKEEKIVAALKAAGLVDENFKFSKRAVSRIMLQLNLFKKIELWGLIFWMDILEVTDFVDLIKFKKGEEHSGIGDIIATVITAPRCA